MWYTSGTTGFPKGVRRPFSGRAGAVVPLVHLVPRRGVRPGPGDGVHLVTSPMYHSSPCAHSLFALHLGHTLVITPRFEPRASWN